MKKLIIIMLLTASVSAVAQSQEKAEILTSAICEMCKETILYDLTFTKGIKDADLNLENKVVTVEFKPGKISVQEIRERISKLGYNADSVMRDPVAYENLPMCCKDGGHDNGHRGGH